MSPWFKLRAGDIFPSPATPVLSWCTVKIPSCIHAIGLLSDKNKDHNVSPFQDKNVSMFSSRSSLKNYKQTSHHSSPLGPFPPDERKKFHHLVPWTMLLLRKSLCLQTLTYGIVHTYLMLWSWERCQQFISPSAISYEHLHQLSHAMCASPALSLLPPQADIYGGRAVPLEIDVRCCPWGMWSAKGTIHPSRTGGSSCGGKMSSVGD